jgi:hypothetical protein
LAPLGQNKINSLQRHPDKDFEIQIIVLPAHKAPVLRMNEAAARRATPSACWPCSAGAAPWV